MEKIYDLLAELRPECDYRSSKDFFEDGLLDSFDVVSLVSLLEETYGITIDGLEILPENFSSVEAIANIITKSGGTV